MEVMDDEDTLMEDVTEEKTGEISQVRFAFVVRWVRGLTFSSAQQGGQGLAQGYSLHEDERRRMRGQSSPLSLMRRAWCGSSWTPSMNSSVATCKRLWTSMAPLS